MLSQALPQLQRLVSDSPCSKAALELPALLPPSPHRKISDLCYRSQLQMLDAVTAIVLVVITVFFRTVPARATEVLRLLTASFAKFTPSYKR